MPHSSARSELELLAIRGWLDRSGRFTAGRCYSTNVVREWPGPLSERHALEMLDSDQRCLLREQVSVQEVETCDVGVPLRWRVTGYIAIREDAATVRLVSDLGILWEQPIGRPPSLKVRMSGGRTQRTKPIRLQLSYSQPRPQGAYLQIIYQWGEGLFQVIDYVEPATELKLDVNRVPGGKRCRLVFQYSDGLRSCTATTPYFSLPLHGPSLTIVKPPKNLVLKKGQPLELEGQVVDRERPGVARQDLSWWIGEELVGTGPIAGILNPQPGKYNISLRYAKFPGAHAEVVVVVKPNKVGEPLPASQWLERAMR
jgi:hypothetical protein